MPDEIEISLRGNRIGGWTQVRVTRSIEELAAAFSVGYVLPLAEKRRSAVPLGVGCSVRLGGQTLVTGYVEGGTSEYDKENFRVEVSGRSRAGDLVDCTAKHESGVWRGQTVTAIATDLCKPFGVSVSAAADVGQPLGYFALNTGESVFEALGRCARMRALLVTSTPSGGVVITRAGVRRTGAVVRYGENVLRGAVHVDTKGRFSQYEVLAQSTGEDDVPGECEAGALVLDAGVGRFRPLVLMAEASDNDPDALEKRAQWERSVRAGKSRRFSYTVAGWTFGQGRIWEPNTMVRLVDERLGVERDLLISSVTLSAGDDGKTTELELLPRGAFDILESPPQEEAEL